MPRLLLVEDDPVIVKVISETMRERGYYVLWAPDVERAGAIIRSRAVEVILSDYYLPDGTALDVKAARDELGKADKIPMVVMSALPEEENVSLTLNSGIRYFVCKPVHPNVLAKALAKAMAKTKTDRM